MNTKLAKKLVITLVVTIATGASFALYQSLTQRSEDARRYGELLRLGKSFKRAWTGQPRLPDRVAALVHFSSPSNYYRARVETQKRALVASGYLVEITVPVPDLRPKLPKVWASITNTSQQTGAYYEAILDRSTDEVRLICRKKDVSLWQHALSSYTVRRVVD